MDIEVLKKFSLFKELDDSQLEKFAAYIHERQYPPESLICVRDSKDEIFLKSSRYADVDRGDEIFFINRGCVSVELPLYRTDATAKSVSELGEGNFFGELSFFDRQKRSANVRAMNEVELLVLSRQDYDKIIKDDPEEGCRMQSKIIAGLVDIIRKMNETYSSAGFLL